MFGKSYRFVCLWRICPLFVAIISLHSYHREIAWFQHRNFTYPDGFLYPLYRQETRPESFFAPSYRLRVAFPEPKHLMCLRWVRLCHFLHGEFAKSRQYFDQGEIHLLTANSSREFYIRNLRGIHCLSKRIFGAKSLEKDSRILHKKQF